MKLFEFIPTLPEVFDATTCAIAGHEYVIVEDQNGNVLYKKCARCGHIK